MSVHHETYKGIHPIVPTAFSADGSFDAASQRRLIDHLLEVGVAVGDGVEFIVHAMPARKKFLR